MLAADGQTHGLVMGRFMPPHNGHRYLIEFARGFADRVTVLVCTLSHEPIPGALRYQWMRELFPELNVVHVTEEIPEAGRENPRAHEIWAAFIRRSVRRRLQYVFASEAYGAELAAELGARFIPVDPARSNFPISATAIREAPSEHWRYIPGPVRPYFQRRVSLLGGSPNTRRELAVRLAAEFSTLAVPDMQSIRHELLSGAASGHARHTAGGVHTTDELLQSQRAAEAALARQAGPVLVCAADALVIALEQDSEAAAGSAPADLYMALPPDRDAGGSGEPAEHPSRARLIELLRARGAQIEVLDSSAPSAAITRLRRFLHEHR